MVVRKLYIPSLGYFAVTGDGYRPVGSIVSIKSEKDAIVDDNSTRLDISKLPITMLRFIECAALCNMSVVKRRGLTPEDQQEQLIHPEKEKSNFFNISCLMKDLTCFSFLRPQSQ
jgi:hypothetical protein